MDLVIFQKYEIDMLTFAGATELDGATMDLCKEDAPIDRDTLDGALTPCTYSGYAQQVITWHDVSLSDDNKVERVSDLVTFRATGSGATDVAKSLKIKTDGGDLVFAGNIAGDGLPFDSALSESSFVVRVRDGEVTVEIVS